jgi:hypothetical protein
MGCVPCPEARAVRVSSPILTSIPDRAKARELAKWVKQNWGPTQEDWIREGKFDLKFTLEHLQGLLIPYWNGNKKYLFRIVINPELDDEARRFVIAHEIGHSFFYAGNPRNRTLPIKRYVGYQLPDDGDPEEVWCDWFAIALTGLKPPPIS